MAIKIVNLLESICGEHIYGTLPDTAAAAHFAERRHLGPGECPQCNEDRRAQLGREQRMCDCIDEVCAQGCSYVRDAAKIIDPPHGLVYIDSDDEVVFVKSEAVPA